MRGERMGLRLPQRGFGSRHRVAGVGEFLVRHGRVRGQRLAAREHGACIGQFRLARADHRVGFLGVGGLHAGAAHGRGQGAAGAVERGLAIGGVKLHQQVARVHELRILAVDAHHRAADGG